MLVALLSILCFAVLAGRFISLPGLQYDEVLFVNAALGGVDDSFIHKRIHGIPVMLLPYIGALKSFLYYLVFKLFGVSVESIRIPVIVISCMTLWVGFQMVRFLYSPGLACLFVLLLATDPAFIFQSKLDWGPVVLMMFFKMLALYWFFRFIRTGTISHLWGTTSSWRRGFRKGFTRRRCVGHEERKAQLFVVCLRVSEQRQRSAGFHRRKKESTCI